LWISFSICVTSSINYLRPTKFLYINSNLCWTSSKSFSNFILVKYISYKHVLWLYI
jgi:hypothetical protein